MMKHKFIALSVLTLLVGMVSQPLIGVRADTYRPTLYDLDYPQAELNNKTIREVFEDYVIDIPLDMTKYDTTLPDGTTYYGTDNGYYVQQIKDYTLTNLVMNGDFSDGTIGWNANSVSNMSVVNGILQYNNTSTGVYAVSPSFNVINGNKYYINAKVKSPVDAILRIPYTDTSPLVTVQTALQVFSGITTATSSNVANFSLRNTVTSSSEYTYIDYVYIINLTAIFGSGNEPSKVEMDAMVTSYFTTQSVIYHASPFIPLFELSSQYSPLYDDTWDNLTDTQIDDQIQDWVSNPLYCLDFDEVGPLTNAQINYWYDHYQTLKWFEINEIPIGNQIRINSDIVVVIMSVVFYILGCWFAYKTDNSWLYAISGLLWFAPLFIIENIFIVIFSISMIIFSTILAFWQKE